MNDLCLAVEAAEIHALGGRTAQARAPWPISSSGVRGPRPTAATNLFDGKAIHTAKIQERAQLGITMAWQEPVRLEGIWGE
jgi:Fe-S cluster assembly ATP-binding protein